MALSSASLKITSDLSSNFFGRLETNWVCSPYPQYRSILTFYLKLRKIIRDAEKLHAARAGLDEMALRRRLKALQRRLDELLKWSNPNE